MNIAFVCDTPFQVLNATNLYWYNYRSREGVTADLYIVDQFRNAGRIHENMCRLGVFDNVYLLRREENRFMPQGLKRSLRVAYSYLNPSHAFRNQSDGEIPKNKYDLIFASIMRCITAALIELNPNAEFMLFDDGTGSYSGDLVAHGGGAAYKLFSKITGRGANAARAKKLYVNNSSMCHSNSADEICQMPELRQDFLDIACKIFDVEKQESAFEGIIMMSEPVDTEADIIVMDDLVRMMLPWKDKVLVRMHPRDTALERYESFRTDSKGEMWELKIAQMDMDRVMLVGTYSTAQLTPKMLYNKEPWLLFTYRMHYGHYGPDAVTSTERFAQQMIESYEHKERIMIPSNEQELTQFVSAFIAQM